MCSYSANLSAYFLIVSHGAHIFGGGRRVVVFVNPLFNRFSALPWTAKYSRAAQYPRDLPRNSSAPENFRFIAKPRMKADHHCPAS